MATLLHHIQPWMQKSIVDVEEQMEKMIAQQMEQKIQVVHKRLDAIKIQVLARPPPTIDLPTLQEVVASLRVNVYSILDMRGHEPEVAAIELV